MVELALRVSPAYHIKDDIFYLDPHLWLSPIIFAPPLVLALSLLIVFCLKYKQDSPQHYLGLKQFG